MAKFKIGDEVNDPISGLQGTIVKVEEPEFEYLDVMYEVVLTNGKRATYEESSLQPVFNTSDVFALCENRNFAGYGDYMIVNTLFKIDNVNNNTISTLRASRTQFKAYQFKPLLKFFVSPSKRILIADEVGLGKTIEAGHILLELKTRKELRHAIIVCPKSLREKWRSEMSQRFGLEFTIYGGEDNEGNAYPTISDLLNAYKSGHDVHAIVNYERIRYKSSKNIKNAESQKARTLIDFILQNNTQQSVVICDESHRLRNEETLSYNGAEVLLSKADAVIFLTATPVMIKEENLYNQMHLLCPEKYSDKQIFSNRMSLGRPFVTALSELCADIPLPDIWNRLVSQSVERIVKDSDFNDVYREKLRVEECFSDDPIYRRIKDLFHSTDNAKTRAALQLNLVKMSAIQSEFTRTTKRQVQNELSKVNERFPCKITIDLTPDERTEFDKVLNDYSEHENAEGMASLGLVQIKRMVSSSVYGYRNNRADLERGIDAYEDRPDSKVNALVREILKPSDANHMRNIHKVIVFAVFTNTLRYLKIRLEKLGIKCALIDGGVADRQAIIDEFRANNEIRVLLSSEVGSEGLDMQFCDTIVNYDLPWNPMVVEQRIGRIDRIGQVSDKIFIYNFVIKDSITEEIYDRLERRIGIFKGTIGDLEPILSAPYKEGMSILEVHNNLEIKFYKGEISKEEMAREEDLIAQAMESQRQILDDLSTKMSTNTISMDSYYDEQIKRIQKRKAYVTDVELRNLLKQILSKEGTKCTQCVLEKSHEDDRVWLLKMPQNLDDRDCLVKFLTKNRPKESDSIRVYDEFIELIQGKSEIPVTFDQTVATENHHIIFVNNYSPLIQACNEYRKSSNVADKKVFKLEIRASEEGNDRLTVGDRFFLLNYQLTISDGNDNSENSRKELCPILFDIQREKIVDDEDVVSAICSFAQDRGYETQMPCAEECGRGKIARFKALATQAITKLLKDKKRDIDEQANVERQRWKKELCEVYDGKINYYENNLKKHLAQDMSTNLNDPQAKNVIAGYRGTITRLKREKAEKLEKMGMESNVSITRQEVSACYVVIR